ncbi:DUF488 family protein [uncultured Alistipes sp.]|jgi:Uncharacterized conserved protein|uniref:DUF488 domain-containing protein n=1 Tax=uncultured Alistipes sp. TaxID=538949 RepID=UPI002666E300|nr:DUF488 domain-containing protein [uncultured Alistipes sp.]
MITLYTIGFTKKSAQRFFDLLKRAKIKKLVDIRINNSSQLAGFAKGNDLQFFVKEICNAEYEHITDLAPTKQLLKDYTDKIIDWNGYVRIFTKLLEDRRIASKYKIQQFDNTCFLCTEDSPEQCHRRLVVEYLKNKNPEEEVRIIHLK